LTKAFDKIKERDGEFLRNLEDVTQLDQFRSDVCNTSGIDPDKAHSLFRIDLLNKDLMSGFGLSFSEEEIDNKENEANVRSLAMSLAADLVKIIDARKRELAEENQEKEKRENALNELRATFNSVEGVLAGSAPVRVKKYPELNELYIRYRRDEDLMAAKDPKHTVEYILNAVAELKTLIAAANADLEKKTGLNTIETEYVLKQNLLPIIERVREYKKGKRLKLSDLSQIDQLVAKVKLPFNFEGQSYEAEPRQGLKDALYEYVEKQAKEIENKKSDITKTELSDDVVLNLIKGIRDSAVNDTFVNLSQEDRKRIEEFLKNENLTYPVQFRGEQYTNPASLEVDLSIFALQELQKSNPRDKVAASPVSLAAPATAPKVAVTPASPAPATKVSGPAPKSGSVSGSPAAVAALVDTERWGDSFTPEQKDTLNKLQEIADLKDRKKKLEDERGGFWRFWRFSKNNPATAEIDKLESRIVDEQRNLNSKYSGRTRRAQLRNLETFRAKVGRDERRAQKHTIIEKLDDARTLSFEKRVGELEAISSATTYEEKRKAKRERFLRLKRESADRWERTKDLPFFSRWFQRSKDKLTDAEFYKDVAALGGYSALGIGLGSLLLPAAAAGVAAVGLGGVAGAAVAATAAVGAAKGSIVGATRYKVDQARGKLADDDKLRNRVLLGAGLGALTMGAGAYFSDEVKAVGKWIYDHTFGIGSASAAPVGAATAVGSGSGGQDAGKAVTKIARVAGGVNADTVAPGQGGSPDRTVRRAGAVVRRGAREIVNLTGYYGLEGMGVDYLSHHGMTSAQARNFTQNMAEFRVPRERMVDELQRLATAIKHPIPRDVIYELKQVNSSGDIWRRIQDLKMPKDLSDRFFNNLVQIGKATTITVTRDDHTITRSVYDLATSIRKR
jgi:hypothetical protein